VQTFKKELMEVVFAWTNGASFATIWLVSPFILSTSGDPQLILNS
jgi:hypothetical protein